MFVGVASVPRPADWIVGAYRENKPLRGNKGAKVDAECVRSAAFPDVNVQCLGFMIWLMMMMEVSESGLVLKHPVRLQMPFFWSPLFWPRPS